MKVNQFHNKNQFHMTDGKTDVLQSYDSTVVIVNRYTRENGSHYNEITLGKDWDYSRTTSKHVYMFLKEVAGVSFDYINNKKAHVEKLIDEGVIHYEDETEE